MTSTASANALTRHSTRRSLTMRSVLLFGLLAFPGIADAQQRGDISQTRVRAGLAP